MVFILRPPPGPFNNALQLWLGIVPPVRCMERESTFIRWSAACFTHPIKYVTPPIRMVAALNPTSYAARLQSMFDDLADIYEAIIDWPRRLAHEEPFYRRLFQWLGA